MATARTADPSADASASTACCNKRWSSWPIDVSRGSRRTRLPSPADCPCHAIYAGCTEFCEVRLQASFNSAAARLHTSAHLTDVAAAFVRNCRRPDQYGLARPGEVREMRVKARPDVARARRHISTRRPDISGTFPYDLSLLRHRVCCREQYDGTDCKNHLLHRLSFRMF